MSQPNPSNPNPFPKGKFTLKVTEQYRKGGEPAANVPKERAQAFSDGATVGIAVMVILVLLFIVVLIFALKP